VNATALLALECTVIEAGWSRPKLREQHAILVALRTARPLDRSNSRWGYRLKFGHGASCITLRPTSKADGDITSQIGLSGIACLFKIAHFEKLNK
jgi:hypothetical protein